MISLNELNRALLVAVIKGRTEAVREFLNQGANVNAQGDRSCYAALGATPLGLAITSACQQSSVEWREGITGLSALTATDVEEFLDRRQTYLSIAKVLIDAGADLNLLSNNRSPLNIACYWADQECAGLLLQAGADAAGVSISPLSRLAVRNGRKVEPRYFNTALHEAADRGDLAIVEMLLAAGADKARIDHEGRTPAECARQAGHEAAFDLLT